jgi:dihydrofolate synthase/folylpolyglutamate synthase
MDFTAFLEHIYQRHSTNVKLGLDRMFDILSRMGNPHEKLSGIHVAGTNGKGSTSAICEALLIAHGHTTGLNTSPHLIDYTERFRINGLNITSDELMATYHKYAIYFDETEASFFEITTALAFKYFEEQSLDSVVFEVGLGGRLDGTNPFKSNVSIITSIGLDHMKTLGDTIELIATEKAGIIKPQTPVVIGSLCDSAKRIISTVADEKQAPKFIFGRDFFAESVKLTSDGTVFDYSLPAYDIHIKKLKLNLLGYHQAINAAMAITSLILYFRGLGIEVSDQNIHIALAKVNWFGRMQVYSKDPLVIIDGAHNEQGVKTLIQNISLIFPNKKYHFLVAILRDKKLDKMIEDICSIAEVIYITKNPSDRAADIEEQVAVAVRCGTKYFADDDIVASAKKCLSNMNPETDMMIVTGSLYTIAEILKRDISELTS